MTQFSSQGLSASAARGTMPRGEEVASFATYAEAQFAVDSLSDDGFPVQLLAIIGTDLRQVENITGRMSWGRAVVSGAGSGLWLGIFFAAMMSFLGPSSGSGISIATAVLLGILWGVAFQVIGYAFTRGKRDFTSTSHVVASRYSIIAAQDAGRAAQALADVPGNLTRGGAGAQRAQERRAARAQARGNGPSAFGSRPDERPRFGVRVGEGSGSVPGAGEGAGGGAGAVVAGAAVQSPVPSAAQAPTTLVVPDPDFDPYLRPAASRVPASGEAQPASEAAGFAESSVSSGSVSEPGSGAGAVPGSEDAADSPQQPL